MSDTKSTNSINLEDNIAGALAYIPIVGIIFLFIEKENKFIRFHAIQSIALLVLGFIPVVQVLAFVLAIFCAYKAYKNEQFELPIVGKWALNNA